MIYVKDFSGIHQEHSKIFCNYQRQKDFVFFHHLIFQNVKFDLEVRYTSTFAVCIYSAHPNLVQGTPEIWNLCI